MSISSVEDTAALAIERSTKIGTFGHLLSGSFAGAVGKLVEHPLDTVKVRVQSDSLDPLKKLYKGPFDCLCKTVQNDGLRYLYRGLPSPLLCSMLENATLFVTFGHCQQLLTPIFPTFPIAVSALSGFLSGSLISIILTPAELLKCRLQVDNGARYRNTLDALTKIWREEGPRTLFRGFSGTLLRESIGCASWFSAYDLVVDLLLKHSGSYEPTATKNDLKDWHLMLAGSCSGIAYNLVMFPADVVKSRMQAMPSCCNNASTSSGSSLGFVAVLRQLFRSEGVPGLYRGLGVTLFRSVPTSALMFYTFAREYCFTLGKITRRLKPFITVNTTPSPSLSKSHPTVE